MQSGCMSPNGCMGMPMTGMGMPGMVPGMGMSMPSSMPSSGMPMSQPMGQPMGQPMCQPMGQPMAQPMGMMGMSPMGMNPMMMMNPMMGMMMNPMGTAFTASEANPQEELAESLPKDKRKGRGKGKLAPNAEHCQMPIDPQVEALCKTFSIEERIMRRLNDVLLTRESTFDADMKALWEVCENASKPSGFLMVKIGEMERGCFTGAAKLDQAMLQFKNRWRLDDRALAKFVEVVHPRDEKIEDMAQMDKLLKGAANPSQAILPMLNHLKAVGNLDDLIREQKSGGRERGRSRERYTSKSRSRSRSRRRR